MTALTMTYLQEQVAEERPAFEVTNPETGKTWRIYANGWTEGFDGPICIINRIPVLIALAKEDYQRELDAAKA